MKHIASAFRLTLTAAGVCLLAGSFVPALGQPGSGGPQPSTLAADPTAVPIDGGASLLLAAGAAYGLKRLRAARRLRAGKPQ